MSSSSSSSDRPPSEPPHEPQSSRDASDEVPPPSELPPLPVNRASPGASNRQQRQKEAEEDRALIESAQKGDQQAFRRLVERHQRRVFGIAYAVVRDKNDAMEISQEAFLRVFRGLGQFKGGSSFFTWLYRIVTNLSIDLMRRPGRRDVELLEERRPVDTQDDFFAPLVSHLQAADPFRSVRRNEIAARLREALDALPPYHLGVILMREVEGMSYEEMAEAMGVSKGTIMSRLFHARQKLQRALKDCYVEEIGRPSDPQVVQPPDDNEDRS